MRPEPPLDESLVQRLPLPLAQLYRRAHEVSGPLERHQIAFYLWEAALKLLASVAVVEYATRGAPDPAIAQSLKNLSRPSLGHWREFVRLLLPPLAAADGSPFAALYDFFREKGPPRDDLPAAAGLDALLLQRLEGKTGARATVCLGDLLNRLVTYRNNELGHGAAGLGKPAFYEQMAAALLGAAVEVLGRTDLLAGRQLVHVDAVRLAGGLWVVERTELIGERGRKLPPLELPREATDRLPDGERVYLEGTAERRPLHPLLWYDAEAREVLFLNARRGRRGAQYLCYTNNRTDDRADLRGEQCRLLAEVLGLPSVDAGQVAEWEARAEADETVPPTDPSRPGLGEYELLSELGRGGMGVVYRAEQPLLLRQVAVKEMLRQGDARAWARMQGRFRREIRALGRVKHPHLVSILTEGKEGDRWFYVMELVEGAPLARVCEQLRASASGAAAVTWETWQGAVNTACDLARREETPVAGASGKAPVAPPEPPTPVAVPPDARGFVGRAVELVRQVAEAAHALHEAGIVHRDIKPDNIQVRAGGTEAMLMDLGVAQWSEGDAERLTTGRDIPGTLRYASPEQVLARGPVDRRSDVYSLGATLWEVLALRPLYDAPSKSDAELIRSIQFDEAGPVRPHNPAVRADLEAVLARCLEKDARQRYATARELAEDLGRYLAGEPVRARPRPRWARAARWVYRRRSSVTVCGLALLVGVMAGLAIWMYQQVETAQKHHFEGGPPRDDLPVVVAGAEVVMPDGRPPFAPPQGNPSPGWCLWEGLRPLRAPKEGAAPSGADSLRFLERCDCTATHQEGGTTYVLLAQEVPGSGLRCYLGWVEARNLLRAAEAARSANLVYRKALIVDSLALALSGQRLGEVAALHAPAPNASVGDMVRGGTIYHIYADSIPQSDTAGYYLLGTAHRFDPGDEHAAGAVLRGWVPKNRVLPWDTRDVLEWDASTAAPGLKVRRSAPGKIYAFREDALDALRGQRVPSLFTERWDERGAPKPPQADTLRLPVIEHDERETPDGNRLWKVGVVGGFAPSQPERLLSAEAVENLQRHLARLQEEVSVTELLFVVDDTASMEPLFLVVAKTIEDITVSARANSERRVRVAVTYFNDVLNPKDDPSKAVITTPLVDAEGKTAQKLVEELRTHKIHDGGDPREQVFLGITRGIEAAQFSPYARKAVILIGDCGDHADENDPEHKAERKVVERLLPAMGSPIEFYAVQVIDPQESRDALAFKKQVETILDLVRKELTARRIRHPQPGAYFNLRDSDKVRTALLERYEALRRHRDELTGQLDRLRLGKEETTRLGPELERTLKEQNIDLLGAGATRTLIFRYGYVWEKAPEEGMPQVRVRSLVSAEELDRLLGWLKRLDAGPEEARGVKAILTREVQKRRGDLRLAPDPETLSFASLLRVDGFAVHSPLLRRPIERLEDDRESRQELQNILKKKCLLEDARKGERYEYAAVNDEDGVASWRRRGPAVPCGRGFHLGTDPSTVWYWIDARQEWP